MKKKRLMIFGGIIILLAVILTIAVILLTSNKKNPEELTNDYMKQYQKLSKEVIEKIKYPFDDKLTKNQTKNYQEIIKKQYEQLKYNITNKTETEGDSIITVEVEVYDLKSAIEKANSYVEVYSDKFQKNNKFDMYKAIDYKLEALNKHTERITYTIDFYYYKDNDNWKMSDLSTNDLMKIDGTY